MWTLKALALFAVTTQLSPAKSNPHDDLMNEIEQKIVLPSGARPFDAYGRNYAFRDADEVIGIYLLPFMVFDDTTGCTLGTGQPCPKEERDRLKRQSDAARASQARPGDRRWFENERDMPHIADGGCMQITVYYKISTGSVSASCNPR